MNNWFFIATFSVAGPRQGKVIPLQTDIKLITAKDGDQAEAMAKRIAEERWPPKDGQRCFIHLLKLSRQMLADWLDGADADDSLMSGQVSEYVM